MLNEVLHLTNGAPFARGHENGKHIKNEFRTSCLEPVTIRKNFVERENALHVKDK